MITDIKDCTYNNKYYWSNLNPNANVTNCLPNCTTLCYGAIIQDGKLPCVSRIPNASLWHTVLINGWTYVKYDYDNLEVGDILEWANRNHVAVVSRIDGNKKIISASAYTGEDGTSKSKRKSFSTMEQVSNFMLANYPTRYFHCWDIEQEFKYAGGLPDYILKHPLYSVKENTSVNQIEVLTYEQNVRDSKNNILKKAEKGFFNVISTKESNGYLWYEVEPNMFIAQVDGRVRYIAKSDSDIDELKRENKELKKEIKELKDILKEINSLSEVE